jgi:putative transposase
MDYRHDRHSVHLVVFHLVWCPKRRKPPLVGEVAGRLKQIIAEVATENGWDILELSINPDHVHLFVRGDPITSAAKMVRSFKGRSSRLLRQEFPQLLKLPSLWTRSYFASTAGNVSQETIRRYIEAQSKT